MTSAESGPQAARLANPQSGGSNSSRPSIWIRELPYSLVLILTLFGVAYTSYSKQPVMGYWELLAPLIAVVCVGAGWRNAGDKGARLRLIWTQALHWFAFLVVMTMMLLPDVQRILGASATGLAILILLALGTFTAGVHVLSWRVCLLGLIMALGVPAIAWIEQSALFFLLIAVAVIGIGAVFWWHWHEARADRA